MIHTIELKQGENYVDERLSFTAYLNSKPRCVIRGAVQVPDDSTQSYRAARPATILVLSIPLDEAAQLASEILKVLKSANIELPKEY